MQIKIRNDSVEITGYVNAIERNSKPLMSRIGRFVERICKGAFSNALKRNDDVHILLNHDVERDLGSTRQGNLELTEDNIGLHARATITDPDVIMKARNGDLVGWSFGFNDVQDGVETGMDEDTNLPLRKVRDLDLREVSILDRTKSPAYDGTLIMARSDEEIDFFGEPMIPDEVETIYSMLERTDEPQDEPEEEPQEETRDSEQAEPVEIDYTKWDKLIEEIKEES